MPMVENIPVLLAANVWEMVIGIIFFILYIVGQLMSASEKGKKEPARGKRVRPPQPADEKGRGGQAIAPQPAGQEAALRQEVEDFLHRAQGKPPRKAPRTRQPEKAKPEPAIRSLVNLQRESISEHVEKHLSSKRLADHADRLGDQVAMADDRVEARLHKKFDHRLGSLQQQERPEDNRPKKDNIAAEIAAMLKDPKGMRQVIIAQEILQRPKF